MIVQPAQTELMHSVGFRLFDTAMSVCAEECNCAVLTKSESKKWQEKKSAKKKTNIHPLQ